MFIPRSSRRPNTLDREAGRINHAALIGIGVLTD